MALKALLYKNGESTGIRTKVEGNHSLNVGPTVYCTVPMTDNVLKYRNETAK